MQYRKENDYLIISNRAKYKEILGKQQRSQEDIIDFLISLHLVLEISLHKFYRHIILLQIKKNISHIDVAQNLDNISFGDKTSLFFYLSAFDFQGNEAQAEHFHKAIGMIKNFCETRNKLLHGHMVGELVSGDGRKELSKSESSFYFMRKLSVMGNAGNMVCELDFLWLTRQKNLRTPDRIRTKLGRFYRILLKPSTHEYLLGKI